MNNFLGIYIDNEVKEHLNNELIKFNSILKSNDGPIANRTDIIFLLKTIDNYVFEEINTNLFFNRLRPSIFLLKIFDEKILNLEDIRWFLHKLLVIYQRVKECFEHFNDFLFEIKDENRLPSKLTPFILLINVFMKWDVEIGNQNIVCEVINPDEQKNKSESIIIYSNNADHLYEELIDIVKAILSEKSKEELDKMGISNPLFSESQFFTSNFDAYEITIHKKEYLIKKFDYDTIIGFPSGISTAYLNLKNNFSSVGFICEDANNMRINYFLCVEEITSFYMTSDNIEAFKFNEMQIIYFLIDFLNILNALDIFKIKLMCPRILFAVDTKNEKKWRFRIDDIGSFIYVKNNGNYENFKYLMNIIDLILLIIKDKELIKIVKNLRNLAETQRDLKCPFYIEILISTLEESLL